MSEERSSEEKIRQVRHGKGTLLFTKEHSLVRLIVSNEDRQEDARVGFRVTGHVVHQEACREHTTSRVPNREFSFLTPHSHPTQQFRGRTSSGALATKGLPHERRDMEFPRRMTQISLLWSACLVQEPNVIRWEGLFVMWTFNSSCVPSGRWTKIRQRAVRGLLDGKRKMPWLGHIFPFRTNATE